MNRDIILFKVRKPEAVFSSYRDGVLSCTDLKMKNVIAQDEKLEVIATELRDIIL